MRYTAPTVLATVFSHVDALSIGLETELEDITVLYDFEGTDMEYGVKLQSGMYGNGSDFMYQDDQEIHLDGQAVGKSKMFYDVPDTPPDDKDTDEDGVQWLNPYSFDLSGLLTTGGWNEKFPNGPGWLAHLVDEEDEEDEFKEHVVHYASNLLGVGQDYFYTPYEEVE